MQTLSARHALPGNIFLDKNEGLFLSNDIHKNITDEIILTYDLFKILHDIENCFITEEEYKKEKS